jgi:hypothetical protein
MMDLELREKTCRWKNFEQLTQSGFQLANETFVADDIKHPDAQNLIFGEVLFFMIDLVPAFAVDNGITWVAINEALDDAS